MRNLPPPIREHLRDITPSPPAVDRLLHATRERMVGGTRRRLRALVLAPALAVATLALVIYFRPHPVDGGALRLASGEVVGRMATDAEPRTIALADGTRLELDPDSTIEPLLNDSAGIELALRRGRVRFVTPPGSPRFTIEIASYRVQVAGAEISVWRTAVEVGVNVYRHGWSHNRRSTKRHERRPGVPGRRVAELVLVVDRDHPSQADVKVHILVRLNEEHIGDSNPVGPRSGDCGPRVGSVADDALAFNNNPFPSKTLELFGVHVPPLAFPRAQAGWPRGRGRGLAASG